MGLLSRASTIFKAKVSKILDSAEDPRETLDYSYERQQELLTKVKRSLADIVTARKSLELQLARLDADLAELDRQAEEALKAGREDLATQVLERKASLGQDREALERQIETLRQEEAKVEDAERRLTLKIQSFRSQKELVKAQYSAAEAQVRIGEAATGISEEMADVSLALDRAREKTQRMQARAGALDELTQRGVLTDVLDGGDDVDRELRAQRVKNQVQADLERLRAKVSGSSTPPSGGASPS